MSVFFGNAPADTFERSAISNELTGIRARFVAIFDTAVWAALLAVAFVLPEGYPRLVMCSILALCSFASILCACQRE